MKELQEAFGRFMTRSENFNDSKLFPDNTSVSPSIAAGSGAAIIGLVLAGVTKMTIFDVTGGLLTGIGMLFAGFTARAQRSKIVKGYEAEISKGRIQMQGELESKLRGYVRTIKGRIADNFGEIDALLAHEENQILHLNQAHAALVQRLENLNNELTIN
jgi:hypothetical protein